MQYNMHVVTAFLVKNTAEIELKTLYVDQHEIFPDFCLPPRDSSW